MEKQEAINKLEQTVGAYLLSGKADDTTCGEWREILETLKRDDTCEDAVSRKTFLDYIENWKDLNRYYHPNTKNRIMPISEAIGIVNRLPSVTPAREQGKWLTICESRQDINGEYDEWDEYKCSKCGFQDVNICSCDIERYKFCPCCGAKMEGAK